MHLSRSLLRTLVLLILLAPAAPLAARPILFDESHGQYDSISSSGLFDTARAEILAAGHSIDVLAGITGAITTAALAGFEVFVTGTFNSPLLTEEILVLQEFVAAGGGVLVLHDGGYNADSAYQSVNTFLSPYGIQMASNATYANGVTVTTLLPHCLTEEIGTLTFDYVRRITSVTAPAVELMTGDPNMLALYDGGSGWVIVCGDDNQWADVDSASDSNILEGENLTLLHRFFGFRNCNETPSAERSWSLVKSLFSTDN